MPTLLYRDTLPRPDDSTIYEPICASVAIGLPQARAAALAGIHEDTLYHWRYKGQEELAANEGRWVPWGELGSHAQLVIRVKEAEAQFQDDALHNWREAKQNWAKWPTLLERVDPKMWGRNQVVEHTGTVVHIPLIAQPAQIAALEAVKAQLEQLQAGAVEGEVKELES